jgi:phosphatidylethanolamine/phosphatidyl-N-methylethanolamine N-methyltransferase
MLELAGMAVRGRQCVLEVAAGTGLVTATLAKEAQSVVATDYADAMVARLKIRVQESELQNVTCEQADLYRLPFEDASFDAVVAANVLHLVPDFAGCFTSFRRVLKPGGILVVPTFCHDETPLSWFVSRLLVVTGFPGRRRFTAASLRDALTSNGVEILHSETLPGLIPIDYVDGRFTA